MSGIITLLTDFGTVDGYVGAMKGAILSITPNAVIIDISHDVPPQDVRYGAFTLMTSIGTFPPGTVHIAVVDPGVGSSRLALAICVGESYVVGPDNGLLSWAVAHLSGASVDAAELQLGTDITVVSLDVPSYWRATVSSTFHGRDIFGPVAAHLTHGVPLERLGSPLRSIVALPFPKPVWIGDRLSGEVLVVDHFGNCITNISGDQVANDDQFEIAGESISGLSSTYEASGGLLALVGSAGFLEIAIPGGSAAERLGVRAGAAVTVRHAA